MTANPKTREESTTFVEITPASAPPHGLLRLPEVMEKVGLRRSAIYQRMSERRFPKCRSLGPKCSVRVEAEIHAWIEKIAQS